MKNAIDWFKEKGFTFDDKITIKDVIELQNDARKDALMEAQLAISPIFREEAPKYLIIGNLNEGPPREMALDGLAYKVTSAIVAMADKLEYLPKSNEK
jgi:hypothetical protein